MENEIFIEINGGLFKDNTYKNEDILENNLFDFRTINLKSNINHLLQLISLQNQLKQTNLKDIDKATDILYLSINFN